MKKSLIQLFSHEMVELVLLPANTTNILNNHYCCGRKISWYHHSGRKPNFSSETSSIWFLVSNALFPPVISAINVLIGHNHFLPWASSLNRKGGEMPCVFPSWRGEYIQTLRNNFSPDHLWGQCSQKKSIPRMCHHKLSPSRENCILNYQVSSRNTYLHQ